MKKIIKEYKKKRTPMEGMKTSSMRTWFSESSEHAWNKSTKPSQDEVFSVFRKTMKVKSR